MQNLPFDHLFCNFIPGEDLLWKARHACHCACRAFARGRAVSRCGCSAKRYLTQKDEQALQAALTAQYGLRRAELHLHFPEALLPQMDFRDLAQVFIRAVLSCRRKPCRSNVRADRRQALPFTFLPTAKQSWSRTFRKRQNFLKSRFGVGAGD